MTNNTPKNDGKVRDIDIRLEFMKRNLKFFEQPDMEFVNEFGVNSTNVVDLAAFDFKNNISSSLLFTFFLINLYK